MSKMIPRRSIDTFRNFVDVTLDNYGIDCDLYIPTNLGDVEPLDIYSTPEDLEFEHYSCQVHIEWKPSAYRLKKLGVFVEDELPLIVYLPNQCLSDDTDSDGQIEVDVDILKHSYIKVPVEFIPDNDQKYNEFELVAPIVRHFHDAVLVKMYKAVPRRVVVPGNRETL